MAIKDRFSDEIDSIVSRFPGGLSNTSTKKFDLLVPIVAEMTGLDEDNIYITAAASRASNLWNRLAQGKPLTRHYNLAVGIIDADNLHGGISPAKRFIGTGNGRYDAIALCVRRASGWVIAALLENEHIALRERIEEAFPDEEIVYEQVSDVSQETVSGVSVSGAEPSGSLTVAPGGIDYAWYVGARQGGEDLTEEFVTGSTWVNGWDDKYTELVKAVKVGDRIAIKSMFTKKRDVPFENNGKTVSCIYIKAIGIVLENPGDGKNLRVDWEPLNPYKVWYIFTGAVRDTISLVRAETSWKHKALLDFTFANAEQDYDLCAAAIAETTEAGIETDVIDDARDSEEPDEVELSEYVPVAMKPEQVIFFGAPGTGKSYDINEKIKAVYPDHEERAAHTTRVTFYPDYEYSDFVGSLRPVRHPDRGLNYEFIPGPMTRILADCFKHPSERFFLIIEEINRGNAPAIFGDLFQLLDRSASGKSTYEITNEEVASYLEKETKYLNTFTEKKIWFPPNLSILCSMNTADQNVFVLDTAFSRRFERVYVPIDFDRLYSMDEGPKKDLYLGETSVFAGTQPLTEVFKDTELADVVVDLDRKGLLHRNWPVFAILVNRLIDIVNSLDGVDQISEDKKLGPFFVSETDLSSRVAFLNKVVYYLKQDVFRYVDQYFDAPFQTIYDQYIGGGDLFALLKMGE